ncbi:heparan-alpha-glucosaminide N-acetyltransferase-like protein [Leptotrombidium deliense]|uniref:Heparan-alpha-glucosaminide N-acetyltransferase-like protein n=1 Tax=Leptotrombidium deliense TaxID=299467 RepID=A0A443SS38_9ACAR|nr:heparan-alpha-glucosaminide N-acetyltransferase-like protein [Leptotrombidium deliense]
MIFVNNNSGGYVFLNHAPWFGYNLADCVFPFFMFIMGISIAFSLQSQMRRIEPQISSICFHIIRRSVLLFFLGIMINSIGESRLQYIRIPGVLQRFAICYLVVALLHLVSLHESRRNVDVEEPNNTSFRRHFIDIYPYWIEWLFVVAMTAIYFSLTFDWKYDDNCPLGYQGPGGLYDNAANPNCTGGAARALDVKILGVNHIYKHSSAKKVFENELTHDPEGILGTTTSILIVFLGLQVGKIFTLFRSHRQRLLRWAVWCFLTGMLALCLWLNGSIPVCKNLWSLTYVMFSAFLAFIVLIVLYILIDVKCWWVRGAPFNIPGMNSIFLYVGHEVCAEIFPFYYEVDNTSHAWLLFRSVMTTALWFIQQSKRTESNIFDPLFVRHLLIS